MEWDGVVYSGRGEITVSIDAISVRLYLTNMKACKLAIGKNILENVTIACTEI